MRDLMLLLLWRRDSHRREARRERALAEQQAQAEQQGLRRPGLPLSPGDGRGGGAQDSGERGRAGGEEGRSVGERSGTWDDAWEKEKIEKWLEEEKLREVLGPVDNVEEAMMAAEEAEQEEEELEQVPTRCMNTA